LDDEESERLAFMRRRAEGDDEKHGQEDHDQGGRDDEAGGARRPAYWSTFEYQSILGIALIGPAEADEEEHSSSTSGPANLEVVIVERDMYDVDQVPRFDGGQDWEA